MTELAGPALATTKMREVHAEVIGLLRSLPAKPQRDSIRAADTRALKSRPGAVARVRLLDMLVNEARFMIPYTAIFVQGVTDLVEHGNVHNDAKMNWPSITSVTRSAAEIGGIMAWLTVPGIAGEERARRALRWIMESHVTAAKDARMGGKPDPAADAQIKAAEDRLIKLADDAKWVGVPSVNGSHPGIRQANGTKREPFPTLTCLVDGMNGVGSYALMCMSAHGSRHGALMTTRPVGKPRPDGLVDGQLDGYGLHPARSLLIAAKAMSLPMIQLARWSGVEPERLLRLLGELQRSIPDPIPGGSAGP